MNTRMNKHANVYIVTKHAVVSVTYPTLYVSVHYKCMRFKMLVMVMVFKRWGWC